MIIRRLREGDLQEAYGLSTTAGWNQRVDGWRMLLALAPDGSFAAADEGRVVGTAIGIDYGTFGWIAMMLVEPGYRGRGLGRRLLEAALEAIAPGRPVRLDATPMGRPLYAQYGFADEAVLTRGVADCDAVRRCLRDDPAPAPTTSPLDPAILPRVLAADRDVFGADRSRVLAWLFADAPQYAWTAHDTDAPSGYCFGRGGRLFDQIGPIAACGGESARALVRAAAAASTAASLVVDAYEGNEAFTAWLHAIGFRGERPLYRMCRPGDEGPGRRDPPAEREFAIVGPEFA